MPPSLYSTQRLDAEFAATGTTQQAIDILADVACSTSLVTPEQQSTLRWRILGTAKNAVRRATRCKQKAQIVVLYQRSLTAVSVGVAAIASAAGHDPTQTTALLVGIGITLLIQLGRELESVTMPVQQWIELRQLIERLIHEVNSFVACDYEYADLDQETRWIWLVSRTQKYIYDSSKRITSQWSTTFAAEQTSDATNPTTPPSSSFASKNTTNDPSEKNW